MGAGHYNRRHTQQGKPQRPCIASIPQREEFPCSHPLVRWADFGSQGWTAQATRAATAPVSHFFAPWLSAAPRGANAQPRVPPSFHDRFGSPLKDPHPIQVLRFPFSPEIRPFNVYSLLTSLLGCYRSPWPARSQTKPTTSRRRIITTHCPLLTTHFSPPFVFIILQTPPPACPPTSIFISIIFMHLQIAFFASPLL